MPLKVCVLHMLKKPFLICDLFLPNQLSSLKHHITFTYKLMLHDYSYLRAQVLSL